MIKGDKQPTVWKHDVNLWADCTSDVEEHNDDAKSSKFTAHSADAATEDCRNAGLCVSHACETVQRVGVVACERLAARGHDNPLAIIIGHYSTEELHKSY